MMTVKLFIAPGCPHCSNVLQALSELIKAGDIAQLDISNMALVPEKARELNIRSVPWVKIGPFEFTGAQTKSELSKWIQLAQSETGMQEYFNELLTTGQLKQVIQLLKKEPDLLHHLPKMIQSNEVALGAKIGIGAIFEEFQGQPSLQALIPALRELVNSSDNNIRHDACYYLGLTESPQAIPVIQSLANDKEAAIRETVEDALSIIADKMNSNHV
ncbi:thioredoxin family protein [sulfur-oxidizing endosymbiont of Gigantopelta aegis]|uniref:thioredoxin family protein n=1 Tax=sulfur-oxidizing endosymbiont of Gigantopelta aegis TaxID=2794934 RepID=UPI001BE3E77E|nr:thioredoxin family protein [sulfur-oxidizing endosymbiont of Gigantopelta aegis]